MNGSGERAGSTRPGVLGDRNLRRVEVELVQRSVRVVAGAVRVVRPGRPERTADEGSVRVVARVEEAVRVDRVRRPGADPEVRRERGTAVRRVRRPDLEVVVRNAVGVPAPAAPKVVAGVVPRDRDVTGRL